MAVTIVAALWGTATLVVFLLLRRKLSLAKCLGSSVLFFISPGLLLALAVLWSFAMKYSFGEGEIYKTKHTREPLAVYGVDFPSGSRVEYEQTEGFFGWRANRTLRHIHSPHPVLLGNIHIDGFIFIPNNYGNTVRLLLSDGQTLDGWPCGETTVNIEHGTPRLESCFLAAPHTLRGKLVPAGTYIYATPDGTECAGSSCFDSLP